MIDAWVAISAGKGKLKPVPRVAMPLGTSTDTMPVTAADGACRKSMLIPGVPDPPAALLPPPLPLPLLLGVDPPP